MISNSILLIAGHLKTQVMCLNIRVVNQLWKSCALCVFRNLHLWQRYNNARLHQMSLWRAAAQERARTWVCGLLAVRRCQSLQGLRYPSKPPTALIPPRLLFLATTNVRAPHLKIATSRPRGRGTHRRQFLWQFTPNFAQCWYFLAFHCIDLKLR